MNAGAYHFTVHNGVNCFIKEHTISNPKYDCLCQQICLPFGYGRLRIRDVFEMTNKYASTFCQNYCSAVLKRTVWKKYLEIHETIALCVVLLSALKKMYNGKQTFFISIFEIHTTRTFSCFLKWFLNCLKLIYSEEATEIYLLRSSLKEINEWGNFLCIFLKMRRKLKYFL